MANNTSYDYKNEYCKTNQFCMDAIEPDRATNLSSIVKILNSFEGAPESVSCGFLCSHSTSTRFLLKKQRPLTTPITKLRIAIVVAVVGKSQFSRRAPPRAGPITSPREQAQDHRPDIRLWVRRLSPKPPSLGKLHTFLLLYLVKN